VLSLLALDESPLPGSGQVGGPPAAPGRAAPPSGLSGTLSLVQALGDLGLRAPLWVLTSGAVAAEAGEVPERPVQAQAWGLGRVVALEHPDSGGGLIDVPACLAQPAPADGQAAPDGHLAAQLCAVLAGCGEDQVALRPSGLLGRRLTRAPVPGSAAPGPAAPDSAGPEAATSARPWTPGGTALVTGGTGAIGGHVARWLAGRGAPRVILASRSGPAAPGAAALAAALAGAGAAVTVSACDSGDRTALAGLLAAADRAVPGSPPLTSVFHAAGVPEATAVYDVTPAGLAAATAAKAGGAAALHELTQGLDLDAFVLFSSIAATWGSALQPGYAAANAYLDALAGYRRGRGQPGTSVAWGPWDGGGMTDAESAGQLRRRGLRPMDPERAVTALAQALDAGEATLTVADVDWARFAPPFTLRRASPLLSGVPEVRQALGAKPAGGPAEAGDGAAAALAVRLAGLPEAGQLELLTELVQTHAAAVLGHAEARAVGAGQAFSDLGADSLTAVELRDRLMGATGAELPATLLFDYPTPAALAGYLRLTVTGASASRRPVLAELDRLESLLTTGPAAADEAEAARITARLEAVLAAWKGSAARARESVADKLTDSSDAEMFDFIVHELGID
jgi:NAD(P)-dependent dehydrogenase (short-subunit alcohol dehydrogenase family)/acyl carrier protein